MSNGGFSEPAKAAIAILQRLGKISLEPELCPWCKIRPASEFDHIEAKANGGSNTPFNGMFICSLCNRKKRAISVEDWIEYIKDREEVKDVGLWLGCRDGAEYDLRIGRKLQKLIGFRVSEPQQFDYEPRVVPRPNPRNPINPVYVQEWKGGVVVIPL
jgi:HNH endonuclease